MGVVYEVEDTSIGKIYVVKTVLMRHAGKELYATLTMNEARMLAKLRHRNIVEVITAGTTADDYQLAYFVMERLEGCTLANLRGVAVPMGYVWQIGRELLDALYYVHHPKDGRPVIVHRDVKPENIFLAKIEHDESENAIRHRVKLLDFGIGAVVGARPEGFWGTARYAAPEQLRLEPVTAKTDLYAAAIVLFELLTGRHPFAEARTAQDYIDAHLVQVPPRLSQFLHVPQAVDDCIDAALSKLPAHRPRDAHKMMSALAELRNLDRPLSLRAANTTIQDLNTVIERHTQAGYEAYASSAGDTIDGMTRPPVDEGRPLESAYPSGASGGGLAMRPTEPAVVTPKMANGRGLTVPMAPAVRVSMREAPTRSLRAPSFARAEGAGTDTQDLLDGLSRVPTPAPVRREDSRPSRPVAVTTGEPASRRSVAPMVSRTDTAAGQSIVLPLAGPSRSTLAKGLLAIVLVVVGAGAVLLVRGPRSSQTGPAVAAKADPPQSALQAPSAPVVPPAPPSAASAPSAPLAVAPSAAPTAPPRPLRRAAPAPLAPPPPIAAPIAAAAAAAAKHEPPAPSALPEKSPPRDDFIRTGP